METAQFYPELYVIFIFDFTWMYDDLYRRMHTNSKVMIKYAMSNIQCKQF